MNLTFRMLQHTSSEVTIGKITNKFKHKVTDWYLIRKMKNYLQTDQFEICKTKQNLASKEKVPHCQCFHSRRVVIPGGGGLPYTRYMGMCRCEGCGFQAV